MFIKNIKISNTRATQIEINKKLSVFSIMYGISFSEISFPIRVTIILIPNALMIEVKQESNSTTP